MSVKTPCRARGSRPIAQESREEVRVSARASVRPRLTPYQEASREEENALRTGTLRCHLRTALGVPQHTRFDVLAHWGFRPAICCPVGFEALHAPGTDEKREGSQRAAGFTPATQESLQPFLCAFRSVDRSAQIRNWASPAESLQNYSRCALFPARAASVIQLVIPGAGAGPSKANGESADRRNEARKNPGRTLDGNAARAIF